MPEQQAFEELLDQVELTDRFGFHEAWFAEHHHSDYGMLASPNLIIAALAQRTPHLRMGNLVNVLPLHDPIRLAEECGILDILTGGRLNVGLGRGVQRDDIKHGLDMDTARARFEEGIEILLRAWTGERSITMARHGAMSTSLAGRRHSSSHTRRSTTAPRRRESGEGGATRLESGAITATARQLRAGHPGYRRNGPRLASRIGGDAIMVRDIYVADSDEKAWAEAPPQITRFWQLATDNVWRGDPLSTDDLPSSPSDSPISRRSDHGSA